MAKKISTNKENSALVKATTHELSIPDCHKELVAITPRKKKTTTTKIVVQYDCGFPNSLFIRGEGISTLSWDKGLPMINTAPNEWTWESTRPFSAMAYKILINDSWYEQGENHTLGFGQSASITPVF